MLRIVRPRDPSRPADVIVAPISHAPSPFGPSLPSNSELATGAEMHLSRFDEPTEDTPITAVGSWQATVPPPLPEPVVTETPPPPAPADEDE